MIGKANLHAVHGQDWQATLAGLLVQLMRARLQVRTSDMARTARVDVLRSLRRFCLECQGESAPAVRECTDQQCALWLWRLPEAPASVVELADIADEAEARKLLTRCALRAIRRHCLNCAGDRREVRACAAREECALWSLRFGVRPETYKTVRQRFFGPKKLSLL